MVTNYILEPPFLRIKPHEAASDHTITIKAISKNFSKSRECDINLINVVIEKPASKSAYYTNFPRHIEWAD
jgi:hypothetical protein